MSCENQTLSNINIQGLGRREKENGMIKAVKEGARTVGSHGGQGIVSRRRSDHQSQG